MSEATVNLNEANLLLLLRQSRAEHEQAGLTGLLLYSDGRFMQVLEGPAAPVQEFFGRIALDPRHCKLQLLADGPTAQREFVGWHMSFAATTPQLEAQMPNYLPLPQALALASGTSVQHLLHEFLDPQAVSLP